MEDLEETQFYVYIYKEPISQEPFYIGYGQNSRMNDHLNEVQTFLDESLSNKEIFDLKGNRHKRFKIKKILESGCEPIIIKVLENATKRDAIDEEIRLIALYGRADKGLGPLTNMTDGGNGGNIIEGRIYINNNKEEQCIKIDDSIPNGWERGRLHKSCKEDNGMYGRTYINNGVIQKTWSVETEGEIPKDWKIGFIESKKGIHHHIYGTIWINNTKKEKPWSLEKDGSIPNGWTEGRLNATREFREKMREVTKGINNGNCRYLYFDGSLKNTHEFLSLNEFSHRHDITSYYVMKNLNQYYNNILIKRIEKSKVLPTGT